MTTGHQGRRRRAPRSGVRIGVLGRGRHAPRSGGLALDDCYMTAADQGRRRHAPRSGVLALDGCYMTTAQQGRRTRRPLFYFWVNNLVVDRGLLQ